MKNKIALSLINTTSSEYKVIACGPITKQPATRPIRYVIVNWGNKLSVHTEIFGIDKITPETDLAEACKNAKSSLESGYYFESFSQLPQALAVFADKLAKSVSNVDSINREEV